MESSSVPCASRHEPLVPPFCSLLSQPLTVYIPVVSGSNQVGILGIERPRIDEFTRHMTRQNRLLTLRNRFTREQTWLPRVARGEDRSNRNSDRTWLLQMASSIVVAVEEHLGDRESDRAVSRAVGGGHFGGRIGMTLLSLCVSLCLSPRKDNNTAILSDCVVWWLTSGPASCKLRV